MTTSVEKQRRTRHAMRRDEITAAVVREDFDFDAMTGAFTWRARRVGVPHGSRVGCVNKHGYVMIPCRRVQFAAHRLAWAHYYGFWPTGQIDHINGDKADNRISNLRVASPTQNNANKPVQRNSAHGVKGAFWSKKDGKWIVRIQRNGVRRTVGLYATREEATAAYERAALEMFGVFAHPGQ